MKYWVFSDARILGPYSREELAGIDAVHAGTLVCQEGTTGVQDGDWRALEAVPELASLAFAAAPAGGFSGSPYSDTLDPGDVAAASWPPPFEDDPRFNFWMREESSTARASELESSLGQMREQLARHEHRQDEILDRLNAKDSVLHEREREIAELRARLTLFETGSIPIARSVAAAKPEPVLRALPPAARPPQAAPIASEADLLPAAYGGAAPAPEAQAPEPEPPLEPPVDESPARAALRAARSGRTMGGSRPADISLPGVEADTLSAPPEPMIGARMPPAGAAEAPSSFPAFGIPESESLSPISDVPSPLDFAPPQFEEGAAPPLEAPGGFTDPGAPPPMQEFMDPAFAPQFQPQQPGQLHTPHTILFQGDQPGSLNLTPGSVPLGGGPVPMSFGATPEPIPLGDPGGIATPMPSMGQPDLPSTIMQGLGVAGNATPFPFGQQTPLPRLPGQETGGFDAALTASRPIPSSPGQPPLVPATAATKPSMAGRLKDAFRSKKFLIILAIAVVALAGILAMFLRNPKQLAKTVDMAPDQKAQGSFDVQGGATPDGSAPRAASPFQRRPDDAGPNPAAAPEPKQLPPARVAQEPAPKGRDFVSDQRVEAMEFVKNYKLDESRGTVGAWLQYSFLGPDTTPEWSAGAIEKSVWFVQYNVFKGAPGGRGRKPTYSFRFEVDLAKQSLKGANPSAQEMLSSGRPQAPKPSRRPARKRRAGGSEVEPLPGDDDLEGSPGSGGTGFNNPGG